ncbi:MAG: Activator of Hsp90 ATPase 1 family protein [Bacteroidetes bacterium]|nr:Activator of Hsp90 ATPase 1 family protein [Bacteroidota bacterium]
MIENPTSEKQQTISIHRSFNLPLSTVWKAWSEQESCQKWWAPEGFECPSCNIDFKVGGRYLNSMKGPDGKEVWSTGTYLEIIPNEKIVCTDSFADSQGNVVNASYYDMPGKWPNELLVIIEFEENNGKTTMHLKHEGLPADQANDCIKGWESMFDKLEKTFK